MGMKDGGRRRRVLLPILTILIFLVIIGTAGITRVNLKVNSLRTPAKPSSISSNEDFKLYITESILLSALVENKQVFGSPLEEDNGTFSIFISQLIHYVGTKGSGVTISGSELLEEKIIELISIMNIEKESDFTKMSLDGRAVAIDIATQIYELCGLRLITSMEGRIEKILDDTGNVLFTNINSKPSYNFQPTVLVITFAVILTLFGINLMIGKKNNLYQKDVRYDEFDEKRFA